jgi:methylated-DNA-[protein]-cysteine S-methyltransferase
MRAGHRRGQDGSVTEQVWTTTGSPVGELLLGAAGGGLTQVLFETHRDGADPMLGRVRSAPRDEGHPLLRAVAAQLAEYFAGDRKEFDLPLAPTGSPFQLRVWAALREIPYGSTVSYGEIARRLGLPPGGSRAVGLANGANPISIIVPCHRVIGADGSLTGYGGGLDRKRLLLDLERRGDLLF